MEVNRRSFISPTNQFNLQAFAMPAVASNPFAARGQSINDALLASILNNARAGSPLGMPTSAPDTGNAGGWGASLRGLSQEGLQKGIEALRKQATWKGSDSSSHDTSTSWGNVGGEKLPDNLSHLGAWGKGTTLAEYEWHAARVGDVDTKASGDWGSAYVKGATDFFKVQGRVYGDAGFKDWTATAGIGVQGRFEAVGSHYEAGYTTPSIYNLGGHDINLATKVNADASVGANGFAEAEIGIGKNTHLDVGAGGFEGASASLAGSESLGDFASVNGGVEVWAGIGAKADLDVGFKDGKFDFHFGAGLALGLGLDYDWGFSINFAAIGDSLYHAGADAIGFVGDAGKWVEGASKEVANWVGGAAETVGNAAQKAVGAVGSAVASAAKDTAGFLGNVGKAVGHAAGDVVNTVGDAAKTVVNTVADAGKKVVDVVSSVFDW